MWPKRVAWTEVKFGVEFEFVEGRPEEIALLSGWELSLDELQVDEAGRDSGAEVRTPPLSWNERDQIREMLCRIRASGARANWSCGLHVHVGLAHWGEDLVLPLVDAALECQEGLRALLKTAAHRRIFCPPLTAEHRERYALTRDREALRNFGRPQSHRCGINVGSWFDCGTVEIRFANGTLEYEQVLRTVELCLKFVAAVGSGTRLPGDADALAHALDVPTAGYPPPEPAPLWHTERMWLEDLIIPSVLDEVERAVPGGEVHDIRPVEDGLRVVVEAPDNSRVAMLFGFVEGRLRVIG